MLDVFDAAALRRWYHVALDSLGRNREEIDGLNVFPVPDADTGTNLFLTFEAAVESAESAGAGDDLPALATAFAHGALVGARGNSGVILSQLLHAAAEIVSSPTSAGTSVADAALSRAVSSAYAAVAHPVEGTMLTVARAAADAARRAASGGLGAAVEAAAGAAREALARTPEQLDVLARDGVVDAGGMGVCVLLDSLEQVVTGRVPAAPPDRAASGRIRVVPGPVEGPAYEVMYLLDADDAAVARLRDRLDILGESLAVVGGTGLWNVHVHVDDVGAAIEAGLAEGTPHQIRVTHLGAPQDEGRDHRRAARAVVAVSPGPGLGALFEQAGATLVAAHADGHASAADVLDAVRRSHAREVVVLPNHPAGRPGAEAAAVEARADGVRVAVVPTRAAVQGLAALAVHDPGRRFDDDVIAMTNAAGATRFGEVAVATGQAITSAGLCEPGDVLGLIDGDVALIGADLLDMVRLVVDRLLAGGGELVTLVTGDGAEPALGEQVHGHIRSARPDVDVVVYDGGQPHRQVLVGVE